MSVKITDTVTLHYQNKNDSKSVTEIISLIALECKVNDDIMVSIKDQLKTYGGLTKKDYLYVGYSISSITIENITSEKHNEVIEDTPYEKRKRQCIACSYGESGQRAHMEPGGCLYRESPSLSPIL